MMDTVQGCLRAVDAKDVFGKTFNLGVGQDISIGDLAEKITLFCERPVDIEQDASRLRPEKSEVMHLISDNSLVRERLGWEPHVNLDEGLLQTIEWISSHLDLFQAGKYEF